METINAETIVSSLLKLGFERVDTALYTYIVSRISLDENFLNTFEITNSKVSDTFKKYIEFDGLTFSIKEEKSKEEVLKQLKANEKLIEYFISTDFIKPANEDNKGLQKAKVTKLAN